MASKILKNKSMTGIKCFSDMWGTLTRFAKKNSTLKGKFGRHIVSIKTEYMKNVPNSRQLLLM